MYPSVCTHYERKGFLIFGIWLADAAMVLPFYRWIFVILQVALSSNNGLIFAEYHMRYEGFMFWEVTPKLFVNLSNLIKSPYVSHFRRWDRPRRGKVN
jgi:hypothetical protein